MKSHKTISRIIAFLLMSVMVSMLAACGNTGNVQNNDVQENKEQISEKRTTDVSESETDENTGSRPSDVSNIVAQADVPMIILNNGVQMPQLGGLGGAASGLLPAYLQGRAYEIPEVRRECNV